MSSPQEALKFIKNHFQELGFVYSEVDQHGQETTTNDATDVFFRPLPIEKWKDLLGALEGWTELMQNSLADLPDVDVLQPMNELAEEISLLSCALHIFYDCWMNEMSKSSK